MKLNDFSLGTPINVQELMDIKGGNDSDQEATCTIWACIQQSNGAVCNTRQCETNNKGAGE